MDDYGATLPMDEIIAQQLATIVDSSQESIRRLASSIFAPLTLDFLNRFSILMLLVQRALFPSSTCIREGNPSLLLQVPVQFYDSNRHENEHLLYFLVVLLCARTPDDSQNPRNSVQQRRSRLYSFIIDNIIVSANLVLSIICLGSLRPMALWCIGSRFFSRQAWLGTSFLAPLFVWFLARIL